MLLSRRNQLLLEFSFWNEPVPRPGPNIYELRSYQLRPGTMIEWGNYWARAIEFRQENQEAWGAFFHRLEVCTLFIIYGLTKIFSPEKTPEIQPGSVKAGMRLFITQSLLYSTWNLE
ncbi:hypothetical protein FQN60_007890 [Etheostoma spectabile]|uniref:NIPSNAP domain-containing protein n=1 Tax=Etheostoma spectabile TaxID=54343 RepID=A0A5J5CEW4_9PERO|nr:hypothetical protein FQN60_007890 [Etheostoma spectabile]